MVIWGRPYYAVREVQIQLTGIIEINSEDGGGRKEYKSEKTEWSKEKMECVGRILCLIDLDKSRDSAGFTRRPRVHELKC